jgi:hypothetical protein
MSRGLIKGYLVVADRVQETAAEARENLDDLAAGARAERAKTPTQTRIRRSLPRARADHKSAHTG